MPQEITIDAVGRLVIPKEMRTRHRLVAGSRLAVIDEESRLVLVPVRQEPPIVEKHGILMVSGTASQEIPDHRELRRQRLDRLGGSRS